jgi:acyl-CoA reductase-like NAD-dependent aldehyde dehydrogenase
VTDESKGPDVRVINLIGGVETAKMRATRAGETLKRTTMEFGGYNPMIILDDVGVAYAVRTATFGSFFHQRQICLDTRRIMVQRKIADEFLKKFAARTKTLPSADPLGSQDRHQPIDYTRVSETLRRSRQRGNRQGGQAACGHYLRGPDISHSDQLAQRPAPIPDLNRIESTRS